MKKGRAEIKNQVETIQMIRFAENIVLLADKKEELEEFINCINDT